MHGSLTLEQKVRLLTGADFWALHAEPAIGLRRIVTSDGPAGVRGERWDEREPSANVPCPTALAATWDEQRAERIGDLLAAECRRKGIDVLLAPTVNVQRTPFAGRHFECLSEDPLLTGRIGAALIRGLQNAGVAATVKHFAANDSETERLTLDARIDERTLRELHLAAFEHIVREARPWAVMAAYNGVNGHTMTESPLLEDVLRGEWAFDGVVMSDWFAARSTVAAALAGLDLVMPGPYGPWGEALVEAVRTGDVPEAVVDAKLTRIRVLAERVSDPDRSPGHWPEPRVRAELRSTAAAGFVLARNEGGLLPLDGDSLRRVAVLGPNAAVARTLGGGSATVFPAHTVSPLGGLRAALPGAEIEHAAGVRIHRRLPPGALPAELTLLDHAGHAIVSETRRLGAYAWHERRDIAAVELRATLRALQDGEHIVGASGIGRFRLELDGEPVFDGRLDLTADADPAAAHMGAPQYGVPISLAAGQELAISLRHEPDDGPTVAFELNVDPPATERIEDAVALAAGADVAIVVAGTTAETESEGFDRSTLALPGEQDELIRRVAAVNPRTIVVLNSGAPVLTPWADDVPVILMAWFGGQELGDALADVLLGAAEPGGRLPATWPASEDGLPSTHPVDGVLAYDEGLAVGYRSERPARFPFGHGLGYTDWEYLAMEATEDGATVRVRNAGGRRGREVVQVYGPGGLAGFAAVEAGPGEEVAAAIAIPDRALAHWDAAAHAFAVTPGELVLRAGRSAADLRLSATTSRRPRR